jgi:hypothetical protein
MRSLGASDLSVEVLGDVRRLRFAASLANVGPGPLLLLPRGRVNAGPDSTRRSKCSSETATGTERSSVAATGKVAGE